MYNYKATVERWVDGDTVILNIDLGFYVMKQERIRLARINTPELNSPVPYHARKARTARAAIKRFCPKGSKVMVTTKLNKRDIFGRYVGEVLFNNINVSDYLLDKGVAELLN